MPKPQYLQKFREVWQKDPELNTWMVKVERTSGVFPKCKYCSCILANKYSSLKEHTHSKKHIANKQNIEGKLQHKINFPKIDDDNMLITKTAECKLAMFIASHGSISTVDHLTPLCRNIFNGHKVAHLKLQRTKCSGIIKNIIAPFFESELKSDIGQNGYSIIIDESTDISVHKYLGCSIKYYSEKSGEIVSTFLDLQELEFANADGIVQSLKIILNKYKLSIHNLMAIGTDNASVMVGINNGVFKKLKEYNPSLILIRCVCHSIQLATSSATKDLPRNLEFLIKETYDWFSRSSLRQQTYKLLYNTINNGHDPLKITQACQTSWLSISTAVTRIFTQWLELKSHFNMVSTTERCYTAQMLAEMYNDNFNYAFICFIKPILEEVNRVNKNFESNEADPTKLLDDLLHLINSLIRKITLPTTTFKMFVDKIEDFVDPNCYLGYLFEVELKKMITAGFKDEKGIRERCIKFLIRLIQELMNRVPENVEILKQMSTFSVENVLKPVKPNIVPILEFFKIPSEIIEKIQSQWATINLHRWNNNTNTYLFWKEVLEYTDSNKQIIFVDLAKVATKILSLPFSNAEVERVFSQMNLIKTKSRNKMNLEMLTSILKIRAGLRRNKKCCHDFLVPVDVIKKIKTLEVYRSQEDKENMENIDFDIFL